MAFALHLCHNLGLFLRWGRWWQVGDVFALRAFVSKLSRTSWNIADAVLSEACAKEALWL